MGNHSSNRVPVVLLGEVDRGSEDVWLVDTKLMHMPRFWDFLPYVLDVYFVALGSVSLQRAGEIYNFLALGEILH